MKSKIMFARILISVLTGATLANSFTPSKIDPSLRNFYENITNTKANVFVSMTEGIDKTLLRLFTAPFLFSKTVKINTIKEELESLAAMLQTGVLSILEMSGVEYTSFWISNEVFIPDAPLELVQLLEPIPLVASIRQEEIYRVDDPIPTSTKNTINSWGIGKIEAHHAWALKRGNRGEGVVVAVIDTGARSTHEALRDNFRRDYGWYDPYAHSATPVDSHGHGTHVLGTIVGRTGTGVAPGAQWIACRGCFDRICYEYALQACGQWVLCPTRPDGSGEDCSKAPDLVSNSWNFGRGSTQYLPVVNSWHSAGIIPIFSIGNSGPSCETANSPGDMDNVISVGSTDSTDEISSFSSRGPTINGNVKPDICAPGREINSSSNGGDDDYQTKSGTSMAAPHVAGVVALLLAKDPNLSYYQVKNILQEGADKDLAEVGVCGEISSNQFPNNAYGHGRLNARRSIEALLHEEEDDDDISNFSAAPSLSLCTLNVYLTISSLLSFHHFYKNK